MSLVRETFPRLQEFWFVWEHWDKEVQEHQVQGEHLAPLEPQVLQALEELLELLELPVALALRDLLEHQALYQEALISEQPKQPQLMRW